MRKTKYDYDGSIGKTFGRLTLLSIDGRKGHQQKGTFLCKGNSLSR